MTGSYTEMDPIRRALEDTLQAEHMCQQSLAMTIAATADNTELMANFNKQAAYIAMLEQIYDIYDTFMRRNGCTCADHETPSVPNEGL